MCGQKVLYFFLEILGPDKVFKKKYYKMDKNLTTMETLFVLYEIFEFKKNLKLQ